MKFDHVKLEVWLEFGIQLLLCYIQLRIFNEKYIPNLHVEINSYFCIPNAAQNIRGTNAVRLKGLADFDLNLDHLTQLLSLVLFTSDIDCNSQIPNVNADW